MDADRFDDRVRSLHPIARRTALGGAFGAGLAWLVGLADMGEAEARNKKRKRRKKKRRAWRKRKRKRNRNRDRQQENPAQCLANETPCGPECVDPRTDPTNCGACDNACREDGCFNGACACQGSDQCPSGCICLARLDDEAFGCAGSFVGRGDCTTDADCPELGSFCSSFSCTEPCRP